METEFGLTKLTLSEGLKQQVRAKLGNDAARMGGSVGHNCGVRVDRRDISEGYHLELGVIAATKTARCGTPVFAPIEVERSTMQAEKRLDVMCLWRDLRSLGLVDCGGGP